MPVTPTTAFTFSSARVVAGSSRLTSGVREVLAQTRQEGHPRLPLGRRPVQFAGLHPAYTAQFGAGNRLMKFECSPQKAWSPKVSKRKIRRPSSIISHVLFDHRVESLWAAFLGVGGSHKPGNGWTAIPARNIRIGRETIEFVRMTIRSHVRQFRCMPKKTKNGGNLSPVVDSVLREANDRVTSVDDRAGSNNVGCDL